jgi:PAS domain S-box-containing protein
VFKFVNSASKELFGYSPEEMVGASFFNFAAPDYQELVKERYRDRIAGKKVPSVYELNILRKDGTEMPVEANANRISFGGKPADLAFLRDITERKRASHDLGERFKELTCLYSLS